MDQKKVERKGSGFANAKASKPQESVQGGVDETALDKLGQMNQPPVDINEGNDNDVGTVTVLCGAGDATVKAGQTIAQIRRTLKDELNIAEDAEALVDSENQGEDMIVKKGQILEFIKLAGTKGQ